MDYSERVRAYFERSQTAGKLEGLRGVCVAGSAGRESEGARIWLAARIVDGKVAEACFRAYGCPHTIALAAWVVEHIEGQPLDVMSMDPLAVAAELELPAEKLSRALCAEDALRDLRANWLALAQSKNAQMNRVHEETH